MGSDFAGRAIIITGAAGGIGGACAETLAGLGAGLVLVDRNGEALEEMSRDLRQRHGREEIWPLALDVTSEDDMSRMAAVTLERFGRIDALVAGAGILRTGGQPRPIAETSFDEWKTIIEVNLTGTFLSNRAVLSAMLDQGEGDIVNISSTSGRQGRAFDGPYSASKFGIVGLSESLAEEVMRQGVRVQTVLPDAVETPLWEQSGTAAFKPRDMLSPRHVAEFIVYLLGLPRDAYLLNPVIVPAKVRARKKSRKK